MQGKASLPLHPIPVPWRIKKCQGCARSNLSGMLPAAHFENEDYSDGFSMKNIPKNSSEKLVKLFKPDLKSRNFWSAASRVPAVYYLPRSDSRIVPPSPAVHRRLPSPVPKIE